MSIYFPSSCKTVAINQEGIFAEYYARLKDKNGNVIAWIDDWNILEYQNVVNDIGYYVLAINETNGYLLDLFEVDCLIEVYRRVPGVGLGWYRDFVGFHQKQTRGITEDGRRTYISSGVGINDLLNRRRIAYDKGTVGAKKIGASESVMKEYVLENCGGMATVANGRVKEGGFPNFTVEFDNANGIIWYGDRYLENLLSILKEIADYASIDFAIEYQSPTSFIFKTFVGQMGSDRTHKDIDASTGKKTNGLSPILFSDGFGTIQSVNYELDYQPEATVAMIAGEIAGIRVIVYDIASTVNDSPWNTKETGYDASTQDTLDELMTLVGEELAKNVPTEKFEFVPLQQANAVYGKHYFIGDSVSGKVDGILKHKRLVKVKVNVSNGKETLELDFSDRLK